MLRDEAPQLQPLWAFRLLLALLIELDLPSIVSDTMSVIGREAPVVDSRRRVVLGVRILSRSAAIALRRSMNCSSRAVESLVGRISPTPPRSGSTPTWSPRRRPCPQPAASAPTRGPDVPHRATMRMRPQRAGERMANCPGARFGLAPKKLGGRAQNAGRHQRDHRPETPPAISPAEIAPAWPSRDIRSTPARSSDRPDLYRSGAAEFQRRSSSWRSASRRLQRLVRSARMSSMCSMPIDSRT